MVLTRRPDDAIVSPMRRRDGILRVLRGDGTAVRALLLALALQILVPMLGMLPGVQAAPAGGLTVCTAHGIVTLVPDGQGGWTEQAPPADAGLSCSFCLPLLSGAMASVPDLALPEPREIAVEKPPVVRQTHLPSQPPGGARPRAPPALA